MTKTLKLVLTDHWFEEIKSGRKNHEYRKSTEFWQKRLMNEIEINKYAKSYIFKPYTTVMFQKAYRKNPERMIFEIKKIYLITSGLETDLHCKEPVFDIELGERVI